MSSPLLHNFITEPDFFATTISTTAEAFLAAAQNLGRQRAATLLRVWCVPYVYRGMEQAFDTGAEPVALINRVFERLTGLLQTVATNDFHSLGVDEEAFSLSEADIRAVERTTGEHYGNLFRAFSAASFWEEPTALLRTRLERNGLDLTRLAEQEVLDAGCGGGRYTVAWHLLGARQVTGVDISPIGIASAQQRVNEAGLKHVQFQEGSVLALPFPAHSFDIVFSNGVLHHTVDWQTGLAELVRVLKPGGLGWLYLIENPGGLYWTVIEVLRSLLQNEQPELARTTLKWLGLPDNRIFYMLDHVMAPVNVRLTPTQIETQLEAVGARQIRRLKRGADFDRIERIARTEPFAAVKYGVGENRYVFSK